MESDHVMVFSQNNQEENNQEQNNQNNQVQNNNIDIDIKPKEGSKEELTAQQNVIVGITAIEIKQLIIERTLTIEEIQQLSLNIRIIKFLEILGGYNKLIIRCKVNKCVSCCCRPSRTHEVFGINQNGEEILLMTASQEQIECQSRGYMLVYRSFNNIIFGALGYQLNPIHIPFNCCDCCKGCCSGCCKCDCCCCCCNGGCCCSDGSKCECFCCRCCPCECCICCEDCCKGGGCCVGGCCIEGCCCCCEDGCCVGGCMNFCNCCCFKGGCCTEPCCEKGCCGCPNYEKPLLDVRILNTLEEAFNMKAGLYAGTLYSPVDCCGCYNKKIGYKKCGERFIMDYALCACGGVQLDILDMINNKVSGLVKQIKSCCCDVEGYEVDLPMDAFPLEKLMIISEIFMFVYLKWDNSRKDEMIITRKRRLLPGLEPNFM